MPHSACESDAPESTPIDHETTTELRPTDVLIGRGAKNTYNPGNFAFRQVIRAHKAEYQTAVLHDKDKIARAVILEIEQSNGRFMQQIPSSKIVPGKRMRTAKGHESFRIFALDDPVVVEKVKQALREKEHPNGTEHTATVATESDSGHHDTLLPSPATAEAFSSFSQNTLIDNIRHAVSAAQETATNSNLVAELASRLNQMQHESSLRVYLDTPRLWNMPPSGIPSVANPVASTLPTQELAALLYHQYQAASQSTLMSLQPTYPLVDPAYLGIVQPSLLLPGYQQFHSSQANAWSAPSPFGETPIVPNNIPFALVNGSGSVIPVNASNAPISSAATTLSLLPVPLSALTIPSPLLTALTPPPPPVTVEQLLLLTQAPSLQAPPPLFPVALPPPAAGILPDALPMYQTELFHGSAHATDAPADVWLPSTVGPEPLSVSTGTVYANINATEPPPNVAPHPPDWDDTPESHSKRLRRD